jgi:nitrate/nitrite transporter NarK
LIALPGGLPWFILSVIVIGMSAVSSAAPSADILFSITPPRLAPLIFSIKQSGQPAGGAFAGIVVPFLLLTFGWREAFVIIAIGCIALGLALSPMHGRFGTAPKPSHRIRFAGIFDPLIAVIRDPGLRMIGLATPFYLGLQMSFSTFAAAYFVEVLKLDLIAAGAVYAAAQAAAAIGRILWGAVAVRVGSAQMVFAWLGVVMGLSGIVLAFSEPEWPTLAVYAVSIILGGTAIAWNGLMFAEVARLSPPGKVGVMTGGMVGLSCFGGFIMPILFGVLLSATGSYFAGFILVGVTPLLAGIRLGIVSRSGKARDKASV